MRRNYILGGIVGNVVGAVASKAIGSFFGDGGGGGTTSGGGSTKVQVAGFLEQSSREAQEASERDRQRRKQENPVQTLIANLFRAYENEGGSREDLNKYWNA